jgi:hypothetical protein
MPKRLCLSLICLALAVGLGSPAAQADFLRLANGDVLKGLHLKTEDGRIHFRSPVLGLLVVDANQAAVVVGDELPPEAMAPTATAMASAETPPTAQAAPVPPAKPATAKPAPAQTAAARPAAPAASRPAAPPKKTPWRSKVEFGYIWQNGRTNREDLNLRFETQRQSGKNDFRGSARYLYAESNSRIINDRRDAQFRWRRQMNERFFGQTNTTYLDDVVRNIDLNIDQNLGVGYNLFRQQKINSSIGSGLTLQYREGPAVDNGYTLFGEVFQDLTYKFNGRLELVQQASALYSPDSSGQLIVRNNQVVRPDSESENYKLNFNSVLRGRLTDKVTINLRYEFEFDNAIANPANKRFERVSTSLGYTF